MIYSKHLPTMILAYTGESTSLSKFRYVLFFKSQKKLCVMKNASYNLLLFILDVNVIMTCNSIYICTRTD